MPKRDKNMIILQSQRTNDDGKGKGEGVTFQHLESEKKMGGQRELKYEQKPDEYIIDMSEPEHVKIQKSILRQKNLQKILNNSHVAVVSNPYLLSLDGQASIDFIWKDLRKTEEKTIVPEEVIIKRKENNLRSLSQAELSKILNHNLQTKVTRKYGQSLSL